MDEFTVTGWSGEWTATSTDCCGTGRTRREAIQAALRMRRWLAAEADRMDREEAAVSRSPIFDIDEEDEEDE